ncbi:MAG: hypothetical protein JW829_03025, partial [Pirellulales bacterium]|nr:hypothetical protein [Pirellulales bacterium]
MGGRSDSWAQMIVRFLSGKQHSVQSYTTRSCRLESLEQRRLLSHSNILIEHANLIDGLDVPVQETGFEKGLIPSQRIHPAFTEPRLACKSGDLDIEITGFRVASNNVSEFLIEYQVSSGFIGNSIQIAIFSSINGTEPDDPGVPILSMDAIPDSTEKQTAQLNANFEDFQDLDYYLIAKVDSNENLEETNERNNLHVFEGGVFLAGSVVHIQSAIGPSADTILLEPLAGDIVVTWQIDHDPNAVENFSWASNEVTEFHIRTHDGNDFIEVVNDLDRTIWGFGGAGNDQIRGGNADDRLHGNHGDDSICGFDGNDFIQGDGRNDHGHDSLIGGDGNDTIHGGFGNDWIEGNTGDDIIDGGFEYGSDIHGESGWQPGGFGGGGYRDIDTNGGGDYILGG